MLSSVKSANKIKQAFCLQFPHLASKTKLEMKSIVEF